MKHSILIDVIFLFKHINKKTFLNNYTELRAYAYTKAVLTIKAKPCIY